MSGPKGELCPRCRREVATWAIASCPVCGKTVCHRCAHPAYGRLFCSTRCGDHFFYGEADEGEDERHEG